MNVLLVVIAIEMLAGIGVGRMAARWLSERGRRKNKCPRQVCGGISSTALRSARKPALRLVTATDSWSSDVASTSVRSLRMVWSSSSHQTAVPNALKRGRGSEQVA
jgi:hypothetical protein